MVNKSYNTSVQNNSSESTNNKTISEKNDGRVQRKAKSRRLIIEAYLSLMEQGNLVPTAQEVADQAGVGVRTVFRQFSEMDSLLDEANNLLYKRYDYDLPLDKSGDIVQRVKNLIEFKFNTFQDTAPYITATLSQLWQNEKMRENYSLFCLNLNKQNHVVLPELKDKDDFIQELVEVALSFETWSRLAYQKKLSKEITTKVMEGMILPHLN